MLYLVKIKYAGKEHNRLSSLGQSEVFANPDITEHERVYT